MRFFYGFAVLLSLFFGSIAFAEEGGDQSPVKVEVSADHQKVTAGQDFLLLVEFKLEPKWHVYWKNPGATGVAPTIKWNLPEGVTVRKTEWSTPEQFNLDGIETYGYSDSASLLVTLHLDQKLIKSPLKIQGDVQWVACSDETCLPGLQEIELTLEISDVPAPAVGNQAKMEEAKASVPKKIAILRTIKKDNFFYLSSDEIAMTNEVPQFFPDSGIEKTSEPLVDEETHQIAIESPSPSLKGVLVVGENAYDIDVSEGAISKEVLSFGLALAFALVGGLILNLMPCVLPVVSLKVMNFMHIAKESRWELIKQGLLFTAGVLVSFWVLAGTLIVLQLSGDAVGWGFQLQEPLFIAALVMLFSLMALSLFGVFELGTSMASWAGTMETRKNRSHTLSSFTSGIFATAVATPCTGPFMGSALGYALTQPFYVSLAIFTALGLGMSLPYILIGVFPSLIRWLPKPGAWMETFKQFLGFLMLATVIWLLWVYVSQTSLEALFLMLGALLILSIGAWVFGRFAAPFRKKNVRRMGLALTLILLLAALEVGYMATIQGEAHLALETNEIAWEPYSEKRIEELRAQNIPVIVDFTAKWCLICQANHVILNQRDVSDKLDEKKVVRMKADWTRKDPEITAALKKHGRGGVPLYLFYSGDHQSEPKILPQVLTADFLIHTLDSIAEPESDVH